MKVHITLHVYAWTYAAICAKIGFISLQQYSAQLESIAHGEFMQPSLPKVVL